jgi:hypothetical protein
MSVNVSGQVFLSIYYYYIMRMEKTKPTVSRIVIPSDKLQFLKKKLDNPHVSQFLKIDFIGEIRGGTCSICRETPAKIVSYHLEGIVVIIRYCDKCI